MPRAVAPVDRHAGALARGEEAGDTCSLSRRHLGLNVGGDATHGVVGGGEHGNQFGHRVHPEVGAGELGDVGEFGLDLLLGQVGEVEVDVVLVWAGAAAFADLLDHARADHVAGCEVLDGGCDAFHEALTCGIAQDSALAARALGQRAPQTGQTCWVELVELHVLEGEALAPDDSHAVAREGVGIRGGLKTLPKATGCKND